MVSKPIELHTCLWPITRASVDLRQQLAWRNPFGIVLGEPYKQVHSLWALALLNEFEGSTQVRFELTAQRRLGNGRFLWIDVPQIDQMEDRRGFVIVAANGQ